MKLRGQGLLMLASMAAAAFAACGAVMPASNRPGNALATLPPRAIGNVLYGAYGAPNSSKGAGGFPAKKFASGDGDRAPLAAAAAKRERKCLARLRQEKRSLQAAA